MLLKCNISISRTIKNEEEPRYIVSNIEPNQAINEYKHIIAIINDFIEITIGSKICLPKGNFSKSLLAIYLLIYKDIIDKITLINEYNPSNIIISESIAHPQAIPNSAKNNAPTTDIFNILFSSFIILTSIHI